MRSKNMFLLKEGLSLFDKSYALSSLILFVTNKCNAACKGCLYWSKLNKKKHKDLSLEEIQNLSTSLGNVWRLQVSGGEPFLRRDLPEICKTFVENNRVRYIIIPTNGILTDRVISTTKEILDTCNCRLGVGISIDGTEQMDYKLRGVKDGFKKSFATLAALKHLGENNPRFFLCVPTRVTNINITNILLLRNKVHDLTTNIDHNIFPVRGNLKEKGIRPPTAKEYLNLMTSLNENASWASKIKHALVSNALDGNEWPFDCVAGKHVGVVDSDGDVRLCELLNPVGNLREAGYDFYSVWNSEKAENQRKHIKSRKCSAGCTHGCFMWPSLLNNPWKIPILLLKSKRLFP